MTKEEILEHFKYINHAYNECMRYDDLKRMLEELEETAYKQCFVDVLKAMTPDMDQTTIDECRGAVELLRQEPKSGHWEFPNSATKMICTCSCCGGSGSAFGKDKFCRNCGAKMGESEDSNNATM